MNIEVDVAANSTVFISNDGSSGVEYEPTTMDELIEAFKDYVYSNPILNSYFCREE